MKFREEQDGKVSRITLASPDTRNFLDAASGEKLLQLIRAAESDSATGAIMLDADGAIFCTGCESAALLDLRASLQKPLVIAVKGAALAGGVGLIANAHVAVAAQGTSFGLTSIRDGRWDHDAARAVAKVIGERRTVELGLTGRVFSTPDALAWGLVHAVAPAFELDDRAFEIALSLANANPEAIRAGLSQKF
jgi:enoyl-CoA hydratase/carnithine racemase